MNEELKDFLKDLRVVLDKHDVELMTCNGVSFVGFFGEFTVEDDQISAKTLKSLIKKQ